MSKLYHDCKECVDIGKELRAGESKEEEYYASVVSLVEDGVLGRGKEGKNEVKVVEELHREFSKYGLLRRTLMAMYQGRQVPSLQRVLTSPSPSKLYPLLDCHSLINSRPLLLSQPKPVSSIQPTPAKVEQKAHPPLDDLNDSSPFAC